jgi:hypothetical protein
MEYSYDYSIVCNLNTGLYYIAIGKSLYNRVVKDNGDVAYFKTKEEAEEYIEKLEEADIINFNNSFDYPD